MRSAYAVGVAGVLALTACASTQEAARGPAPVAHGEAAVTAVPSVSPEARPLAQDPDRARPASGTRSRSSGDGVWVGAAAESDVLLAGGGDAFVGIWVDVPDVDVPEVVREGAGGRRTRAPVDLALVVDTSGSMEGAKIQAARASARTLVQRLADGDVLSVDTFSDHARALVPPVVLTPENRARVLSILAELGTGGSTNMFEGLQLAEMHVGQTPDGAAPALPAHGPRPGFHPVRRIVMISDGQANVGLSSPQALGELAQRSLSLGAQITSLGVGLDYDERTLDAIAERTSGRLFHVGDPREMVATLEHEIDLLAATVADQASIEVVPAPGVVLVGVEGARVETEESGAVRIPLGALYAGQHREALLRVRLSGAASGTQRALASVRLQFRDPAENDVERVQEVLARAMASDDPLAVAVHVNAKTHAMMAMVEAARTEIQAAQDVGSGNFVQAEAQLATAEQHLREEASKTKDDDARKKLTVAAQGVASARSRAASAPAAPAAAVRLDVLEMNSAGMKAMGY
jgi:Ca-activated chloride channel family protein